MGNLKSVCLTHSFLQLSFHCFVSLSKHVDSFLIHCIEAFTFAALKSLVGRSPRKIHTGGDVVHIPNSNVSLDKIKFKTFIMVGIAGTVSHCVI